MSELIRFGVSINKDLISKFDRLIKIRSYSNRSEAFRDLIRRELVKEEWKGSKEVAGAIIIIYDHHKRELLNKITDIQHDFQKYIISTQHIHLDHNNCLEMIAVRGRADELRKLSEMLHSLKGVKHAVLSMSSTGKDIS